MNGLPTPTHVFRSSGRNGPLPYNQGVGRHQETERRLYLGGGRAFILSLVCVCVCVRPPTRPVLTIVGFFEGPGQCSVRPELRLRIPEIERQIRQDFAHCAKTKRQEEKSVLLLSQAAITYFSRTRPHQASLMATMKSN